ncbi:MAG: MEKHLA domain-containing protein [Georgfuchsia sp.]
MIALPRATPELIDGVRLIADSFTRLLQRPLVDAVAEDVFASLWLAPRVVVAHGTGDDPIFFYGNRLALELFEMDFSTFTQLPSRLSAEPLQREARARLLAQVSRQGYIDDYAGVRISSTGKRFAIKQAVVWNLADDSGRVRGQAATFDRWQML